MVRVLCQLSEINNDVCFLRYSFVVYERVNVLLIQVRLIIKAIKCQWIGAKLLNCFVIECIRHGRGNEKHFNANCKKNKICV